MDVFQILRWLVMLNRKIISYCYYVLKKIQEFYNTVQTNVKLNSDATYLVKENVFIHHSFIKWFLVYLLLNIFRKLFSMLKDLLKKN